MAQPHGHDALRTLRWVGAAGTLILTGAAWVSITTGSWAALAAGIAGAGLVVLAWGLVGQEVLGGAVLPRRWAERTLAVWCAPLLVAPPLFSRDVYSYLAQGLVADPYGSGPAGGLDAASEVLARVDGYWRATPSPYGPVFTAVERSIAQLSGGEPVPGVLLHRAVELAGVVLVVRAVPRLCALSGASPGTGLWLGVLNPLVGWHLVAGAHCDALMLGLALTGVVVALDALRAGARHGVALGVVLVSLGALVKLTALVALMVVGIALAREHRTRTGDRSGAPDLAVVALGVLAAFAAVACAVSLVTGLGPGWAGNLAAPTLLRSWLAPTNWPGYLTGSDAVLAGGRAVGVVAMVVLVTVVAHRQWRGRVDPVTALGAMSALVVALGPAVQPWYVLMAAIPLAAAPARSAAVAGIVTGCVALAVPPLAGDFTGTALPLVIGYANAALVVGVVFVILRRAVGPGEGMMRTWLIRRAA